jgi:hypothetical protein
MAGDRMHARNRAPSQQRSYMQEIVLAMHFRDRIDRDDAVQPDLRIRTISYEAF